MLPLTQVKKRRGCPFWTDKKTQEEEAAEHRSLELPSELLGYSRCRGRGCSRCRHGSSEHTDGDGWCESPCGGGESHSPPAHLPPTLHGRSSWSSPHFHAATTRSSQRGHGDNTHRQTLCWGSVRSSTCTLEGKSWWLFTHRCTTSFAKIYHGRGVKLGKTALCIQDSPGYVRKQEERAPRAGKRLEHFTENAKGMTN